MSCAQRGPGHILGWTEPLGVAAVSSWWLRAGRHRAGPGGGWERVQEGGLSPSSNNCPALFQGVPALGTSSSLPVHCVIWAPALSWGGCLRPVDSRPPDPEKALRGEVPKACRGLLLSLVCRGLPSWRRGVKGEPTNSASFLPLNPGPTRAGLWFLKCLPWTGLDEVPSQSSTEMR